jgi:hypothetical protein
MLKPNRSSDALPVKSAVSTSFVYDSSVLLVTGAADFLGAVFAQLNAAKQEVANTRCFNLFR